MPVPPHFTKTSQPEPSQAHRAPSIQSFLWRLQRGLSHASLHCQQRCCDTHKGDTPRVTLGLPPLAPRAAFTAPAVFSLLYFQAQNSSQGSTAPDQPKSVQMCINTPQRRCYLCLLLDAGVTAVQLPALEHGRFLESGLVSQSPAPTPGSAPGCPHKPLGLRLINCHQLNRRGRSWGERLHLHRGLLPAGPGAQMQPRRDGRGGVSIIEGELGRRGVSIGKEGFNRKGGVSIGKEGFNRKRGGSIGKEGSAGEEDLDRGGF